MKMDKLLIMIAAQSEKIKNPSKDQMESAHRYIEEHMDAPNKFLAKDLSFDKKYLILAREYFFVKIHDSSLAKSSSIPENEEGVIHEGAPEVPLPPLPEEYNKFYILASEATNEKKRIINYQLFAIIKSLSNDLHTQIGRLEDINQGQFYYRMLRLLLTPGDASDHTVNLEILKQEMADFQKEPIQLEPGLEDYPDLPE